MTIPAHLHAEGGAILRVVPTPQASPLSLVLEEVEVGRAIFTSTLPEDLGQHEAARVYRTLAEFAAEAAVQSALFAPLGFRVLALKLHVVRAVGDLPRGAVEARAELVGRGPKVLRAVARIHDAHDVLRARATLVAVPVERVDHRIATATQRDAATLLNAGSGTPHHSPCVPEPAFHIRNETSQTKDPA